MKRKSQPRRNQERFEKVKIIRTREFQGTATVSRIKTQHSRIEVNHRLVHMIERRLHCLPHQFKRVHQHLQRHPHRYLSAAAAYGSLDAWAILPVHKHRTLMNKIHSSVNDVCFGPQHEYVLTASQNGQFTWYDSSFKFELVFAGSDTSIQKMRWNRERSRLLTCHVDGKVKLYANRSLNEVCEATTEQRLFDVAFSPTCGKFAVAGENVFVFDTGAFTLEHTFERDHGYDTKKVAWHDTRSLLATCGANQGVRLLDPRCRQSIATITEHTQNAAAVEWVGEHFFVSGGKDKIVNYVDVRTRRCFRSIEGAPAGVTALRRHPTHMNTLVVGCFDGSHGFLIDREPAHMVKHHRLAVTQIAFHPLAHFMLTSSRDGSVAVHRQHT